MSPDENLEAVVIASYVKALDSLQKALDCPKQRFKPEVLCATEILALYELLDPSGEIAWIRHAAGAARLIQLRGPENYKSEFEKALFMAHSGPIMTECLLNDERCFLEDEPWKAVFQSIIVEGSLISDRSEIVINLLILKCCVPGAFHDTTKVICHPEDAETPDVIMLAARIRALRADLLQWHDDWELLLRCAPRIHPGSVEYDRRCKVFATYLSCLMLSSRLLAAISPHERQQLEADTQQLARQMMDLEIETQTTSSSACLFMAQTAGVAKATRATAQEWWESCELKVEDGEASDATIEKWKFDLWCQRIGRKLS